MNRELSGDYQRQKIGIEGCVYIPTGNKNENLVFFRHENDIGNGNNLFILFLPFTQYAFARLFVAASILSYTFYNQLYTFSISIHIYACIKYFYVYIYKKNYKLLEGKKSLWFNTIYDFLIETSRRRRKSKKKEKRNSRRKFRAFYEKYSFFKLINQIFGVAK